MSQSAVTRLLVEWRGGRRGALDELIPLVHDDLRRIAGGHMRREGRAHTLQATAVVNEAYLKLVDAEVDWNDRVHFFAVAARLMRRVLVDHAKAKRSEKRGGAAQRVTLEEERLAQPASNGGEIDVVEFDQALKALAKVDERKARVVELHYFGGLNYDEIAEALEISAATVHRDLRLARAWLHRELSGAETR